MKKILCIVGLGVVLSINLSAQCNCSIFDIVDDYYEPHEAGTFVGVPLDHSWSTKADIDNLDALLTPVHKEITAWGQVYIADKKQPVLNARVAIRNVRLYMLKDSVWHAIQNEQVVHGAYFVSDYKVNGDGGLSNKYTDKQYPDEADISVRPIVTNNFHFWPKNRGTFNPEGVQAFISTAEFKLVKDLKLKNPDFDNNGINDLDQAKFQSNIGGDLWLPGKSWKWDKPEGGCYYDGYAVNNRGDGCAGNIGMGQGTARYVTREWTSRFAIFAPEGEHLNILKAFPPPIENLSCGNR